MRRIPDNVEPVVLILRQLLRNLGPGIPPPGQERKQGALGRSWSVQIMRPCRTGCHGGLYTQAEKNCPLVRVVRALWCRSLAFVGTPSVTKTRGPCLAQHNAAHSSQRLVWEEFYAFIGILAAQYETMPRQGLLEIWP